MDRIIIQLGRSKAILFFVVIIGFILGYFSYSAVDPLVGPNNIILPQDRDSLDSLAGFDIDFSILDNDVYKSLEIFGENPVDPEITGEKRDPFAPI